jgi:hypothetical protein
MSSEDVYRMLEIMSGEGGREKDAWVQLAKAFPQFSKEELMLNFLQVPMQQKMNGNIFDSNEDLMEEAAPIDDPTIFEDYENQEQLSIALSYYLYKTQPAKYPELAGMFQGAVRHAADMAHLQHQKCVEMLRMLIDVQQSKL